MHWVTEQCCVATLNPARLTSELESGSRWQANVNAFLLRGMAPRQLPLLSLTRLLLPSSKNTFKSHSHTNLKKGCCCISFNCAFMVSTNYNCPIERESMISHGPLWRSNAWPEWPWGRVTWHRKAVPIPFSPSLPPRMRLSGRQWKMCRQTKLRGRWIQEPLPYATSQLRMRLVDCLFTHLINHNLNTQTVIHKILIVYIVYNVCLCNALYLSIYLSIKLPY